MRRLGAWEVPGKSDSGAGVGNLVQAGRQRTEAPRRGESERRQEPYPLRMRPDENRALRMDGWMDKRNRFIRPARTHFVSFFSPFFLLFHQFMDDFDILVDDFHRFMDDFD